jgi:hypothetical protein
MISKLGNAYRMCINFVCILVIKFNLLKLVFYAFLKHRPIGFLVYFPLKLKGAFTTLLFSFCIGLVLNTICIMKWYPTTVRSRPPLPLIVMGSICASLIIKCLRSIMYCYQMTFVKV